MNWTFSPYIWLIIAFQTLKWKSQVDFGSGLKFVDNASFTVIFFVCICPLSYVKTLKISVYEHVKQHNS